MSPIELFWTLKNYKLFGFAEFGFNPNETVALMGAHTLGQVIIFYLIFNCLCSHKRQAKERDQIELD